ncbi:hypothetical protein [Vibrio hyugaensis]|uniref:hypothetical protein n=1 Tax=Vibrio hyugaensis TaxID=1534743 RepID=UPI003DA11C8B
MSNPVKQAFREVYRIERTQTGANRYLAFYEVFQKYPLSDSTMDRMPILARVVVALRKSRAVCMGHGSLESRLSTYKRLGKRSCFKNY